MDLQPGSVVQNELELQPCESPARENLMTTLDGLNQRFGKGTVLMASTGPAAERRAWAMKQQRLTPAYTTCWADLAVVRA